MINNSEDKSIGARFFWRLDQFLTRWKKQDEKIDEDAIRDIIIWKFSPFVKTDTLSEALIRSFDIKKILRAKGIKPPPLLRTIPPDTNIEESTQKFESQFIKQSPHLSFHVDEYRELECIYGISYDQLVGGNPNDSCLLVALGNHHSHYQETQGSYAVAKKEQADIDRISNKIMEECPSNLSRLGFMEYMSNQDELNGLLLKPGYAGTPTLGIPASASLEARIKACANNIFRPNLIGHIRLHETELEETLKSSRNNREKNEEISRSNIPYLVNDVIAAFNTRGEYGEKFSDQEADKRQLKRIKILLKSMAATELTDRDEIFSYLSTECKEAIIYAEDVLGLNIENYLEGAGKENDTSEVSSQEIHIATKEVASNSDDKKANKGNSFINTGEFWLVTYNGNSKNLKKNDRLKYIAYLLNSPEKEWEYRDLYELVSKKGSLDDVGKLEKDRSENYSNVNISKLSDDQKKTWGNLIKTKYKELQDAERLSTKEEWAIIDDDYNTIKKTFENDHGGLIKESKESNHGLNIIFRDRLDPVDKRAYDKVRKQIIAAIKQIKNAGLSDLADHLKYIKKNKSYQPPPNDPKWDVVM